MNNITVTHYLILSSMIFSIAILGLLLQRSNVLKILFSLELMMLAVNINFIAFSYYSNDITGQIASILILAITAVETAIGLSIFIVFFREQKTIQLIDINKMEN